MGDYREVFETSFILKRDAVLGDGTQCKAGERIRYAVELQIDVNKLVTKLGWRAAKAKSGRTTAIDSAIAVTHLRRKQKGKR